MRRMRPQGALLLWPGGCVHCACFSLFQGKSACASKDSLRRLSNISTRKSVGEGATGKRAGGLVEAFRTAINQRRHSPEFASLTVVQAEQQLLLRCDVVTIDASILNSNFSFTSSSAAEASAS
eukprot:4714362-Pleurochrysis_carterae.AAC.1